MSVKGSTTRRLIKLYKQSVRVWVLKIPFARRIELAITLGYQYTNSLMR